jgi:hypothetical protein
MLLLHIGSVSNIEATFDGSKNLAHLFHAESTTLSRRPPPSPKSLVHSNSFLHLCGTSWASWAGQTLVTLGDCHHVVGPVIG